MFKTLRYRLLALLLLIALICSSIVFISIEYAKEKEEVASSVDIINKAYVLLLQDFKIINDFLSYDLINPEFFETRKSIYIQQHNKTFQSIVDTLNYLKNSKNYDTFNVQENIEIISKDLSKYNDYFEKMVEIILLRGFKDYGTEGIMRDNIHKLEGYSQINQRIVLTLRRHEKDFIIRNDKKYVVELIRTGELLRENIFNSQLIESEKDSCLLFLDNYLENFHRMVVYEDSIGIKNNSGLKRNIDEQAFNLQLFFTIVGNSMGRTTTQVYNRMRILFAFVSIFIIAGSIAASLYISKRFTARLSLLAKHMSDFVKSDFSEEIHFDIRISDDEVGKLISSARILRQEIIALILDFQKKVEERTMEITLQKNRIEAQKEEITTQHDEIVKQKNIVDQRNKYIVDSIQYAKRIQQALLPADNLLEQNFADFFLIYQPKDIISGDFYWFKHIKNRLTDSLVIAVADCTGHGVPGALMSMLGIAFLNEIIMRKGEIEAGTILGKLRESIIVHLCHDDNNNRTSDGLDIALCTLNRKNLLLQFAGANRPLYIIRNRELLIYKGDKMPIGSYIGNRTFATTNIQLQKNDCIYMFSDGFTDQFGGDKNRKFMVSRFRSLLISISHLEMKTQKETLISNLSEWQGRNYQVDDILVMGLKV